MSCSTNVLTPLGSDALNQAAGALNPAVWTTPIEVGGAVVLNGTSAFGGGGTLSEAKYIGAVVPPDQYAEIQWKYSGILAPYVDLTFRRDPVAVASFFLAAFAHGGTFSFLLDNNGTWESDFNLSTPLATGDKLRVAMLGLQVCVWRDTGSGYVLEHTDTLPALLPTGGTVAGQSGFTLSGQGLANNFATGSVSGPVGQTTISGTWQYPNGTPVANGKLYLRLSQDAQAASSVGQVSGRNPVVVTLDANGSIPGGTVVYGNDNLTPAGTFYRCSVVSPTGVLVWGWEAVSITGGSFNFNSGFTSPLPQQAGRP